MIPPPTNDQFTEFNKLYSEQKDLCPRNENLGKRVDAITSKRPSDVKATSEWKKSVTLSENQVIDMEQSVKHGGILWQSETYIYVGPRDPQKYQKYIDDIFKKK